METFKHPVSIDINVTVKPDISVQIDYGNGSLGLWQCNFKWMIAFNYSIYTPSGNNYWQMNSQYGINELEEGLCYWNGMKWQLFEDEVQVAYSDYIAEKEILK